MQWCTATRYPKLCYEAREARRRAKKIGYGEYQCPTCGFYHLTKGLFKPKEVVKDER